MENERRITVILKRALACVMVAFMLLASVPVANLAGLDLGLTASAASYKVGDIIQYGNYPQSKVTDRGTLAALDSISKNWRSLGYYSGTGTWDDGQMKPGDYMKYADVQYGGSRYRAIHFTKYRPYCTGDTNSSSNSYQDDNGYYINTTYYFKFEPLKWRVLDPAEGLIMSESLIDSQAYQNTVYYYSGEYYQDSTKSVYANDYAKSSIRKWLNNDFYNTAFSSSQKSNIKTTSLNNDCPCNSKYNSAPTNDKIFLLSYNEVKNSSYGFSSDYYDSPTREAKGTDYAKCQGLWVSSYKGNSLWRLRSPYYDSDYACYVRRDGYVNDDYYVVGTSGGVRAACKLSNLKSDISQSEIWEYANGNVYASPTDGEVSLYVEGRPIVSGEAGETIFYNKAALSIPVSLKNYAVSPNVGATTSTGEYKMKYTDAVKSNFTISKDDYQKYIIPQQVFSSIKNESLGGTSSLTATLNLDKKDGKPYVSTVFGKIDSDSYSYKELSRTNCKIEEGNQYSIIISACDVGSNAKYYLYQDSSHKLESSTGVFSGELYSRFSDELPIYAYVKGSNGTSPAVVLKLEKVLSESDAQMKELIDSGEISLLGNIQSVVTSGSKFLDKAKLDLSVFKIPIDFTFEDNTLKVSIGLKLWNKEKATKGSSTTGKKYKDDWEYSNFVTDFKKLWSDPSKDLTKKYTKAKQLKEKYDKTVTKVKERKKAWDFSFLGYAEWEYINGKYVFKEGLASLCGSYSFSYSQQGFVWVVPEYTYFQAKIDLTGSGKMSKSGPSDLYPLEFDLSVSTTPQLKVGGGVGVKDLLSAGFWGKASLPTTFNFTRKHLTMDAKGEFGYETKFLFIFGTEKTLLEGSVNLIDKYWSTSAKKKSQLMFNSPLITAETLPVKSEDVPLKIENRDYAENTSAWLGERHQNTVKKAQALNPKGGISFKTLQTSIFEGATPKIAAVGNTMIMTFVQDDTLRDTYNRMRLVYSIFDPSSKTWSAPLPVYDDGKNDVNPVIVSDGENVYVAWQKICKTLSESTTNAKDICENTEIYLAKYNQNNGSFENTKRITNNACYDYAQSIGIFAGKPVVYYASCTDNNMNGTSNTSINKFENETTTKLLAKKNYIYSIETNAVGSEFTFIMDKDGDNSDNSDVKAFTYSNANVAEISFDAPVTGVDYIALDGKEELLLTDGNNIYEIKNNEWTPILSNVANVASGIKSTVVDGNTVLSWIQTNEDGSADLYYAIYSNGQWSESVRASAQNKRISSVDVSGCGNKLYGIVTKTTINTDEEGNQSKGQVDLESFEFSDYADLELGILSANEGNFNAGKDSEFDVLVTNNGTVDINTISFNIEDTLGTSKTETKDISLKPGESKTISLTYPVPENYSETTLTVEADIIGLNDVVPENNKATQKVGLPDLYFENTNILAYEDGYLVETYLYNASDAAAKNIDVSLKLNDEDADDINIYSAQSLETKDCILVRSVVNSDELKFDENGLAYAYMTASSEGEDSFADDNVEKVIFDKNSFVDFNGHDYKEEKRVEPTCLKDGYILYHCSICDDSYTEVIPATGNHTPASVLKENEVVATCTNEGSYDEVVYCSVCKTEINREKKTTERTAHTPSAWIIDEGANCITGGSKHKECTVCGEIFETETIPSTGRHTYVDLVTKPTCITQGYTTHTCSVCGQSTVDTYVNALGHKPSKAVKENQVASTCTKEGSYYEVVYCSVCKTQLSRAKKTVAKKSHTFTAWKVTKKATYTATGTKARTCTVCGKAETQSIAKLKTTAITKCSVKLSLSSAAYTGKALKPTVTVKNGKTTLKAGTHYTVTYKNNTKIGKATVTITGIAKNGYTGTKTLTFNIIPANVKNLKATQTTTSVTLSWSKVAGAKGYRVYKYDTKTKKWVKVADTTKTKFTIKKLKAGTSYKYAVKAYTTVSKTTYWSAAYAQLSTATKPATPTLKATAGKKQATLSWKKVSGASGYVVYMATGKNGSFKKVATIKKGSTVKYTKKSLKKGTTYRFKIMTYKTVSGKNIYSGYSAAKTVKAK